MVTQGQVRRLDLVGTGDAGARRGPGGGRGRDFARMGTTRAGPLAGAGSLNYSRTGSCRLPLDQARPTDPSKPIARCENKSPFRTSLQVEQPI